MTQASPTSPVPLPTNLSASQVPRAASAAWRPELRLRKHADYQRVYKSTRKQFSNSMSWFMAARPELPVAAADGKRLPALPAGPRVGLTVGKGIGKAHERNRIKRRMREAVRKAIHVLPEGVDLILHPKRQVMEMDFGKLETEVLRIFRQAAGQARQTRVAGAAGPQPLRQPLP